MSGRSFVIASVVGGIAALLGAPRAMAQPVADEAKVAAMENEAQLLCASGKAAEGAILLARLYVETGETHWIFNQGRCFEENGLYDEAILRFEEFLRKEAPDVEEKRSETEQRIESLRARIVAERAAKQPPSVVPMPKETPPADVAPRTPLVPSTTEDAASLEASADDRPVHEEWWFWTGIGSGVAIAVLAAVLLGGGDGSTVYRCPPTSTETCDPLPN